MTNSNYKSTTARNHHATNATVQIHHLALWTRTTNDDV
jgi:hypothetical protein